MLYKVLSLKKSQQYDRKLTLTLLFNFRVELRHLWIILEIVLTNLSQFEEVPN